MNQNKLIVVVLAAVVIGVGIVAWSTVATESAENRLNRQIDEKLQQARGVLNSYHPTGARLLRLIESGELIVPGPDAEAPLRSAMEIQQRRLRDTVQHLAEPARRAGAPDPGRAMAAGPPGTLDEIKANLRRDEATLSEALKLVNAALALSVTSRGETISGRQHPDATRLKALLTCQQAELLRQRAAFHRLVAESHRQRFDHMRGEWLRVDALVRSLEGAIHGDAPPRRQPGDEAPEVGAIGRFLRDRLPQARQEDAGEEDADEPERMAPTADPDLPDQLPTMAERRADLEGRAAELAPQIRETRAAIEHLEARVTGLERDLAEARTRAADAETAMFALEDEGVDPIDPGALEAFERAYRSHSDAHREASRRAMALEHGAILNARPDTADDDEMLTAPLVPADPTKEMTLEPGLIALKSDLAAAKDLLAAQEAMRSELERQISELDARETELNERLARLRAERDTMAGDAARWVRAAVAEVLRAEPGETEALDLTGDVGEAAVAAARTAASAQTRNLSELSRRHQPDQPAPRLTVLTGFIETLDGDLAYLRATIEAQRAKDLERHHRLLAAAEDMGISMDETLLPDDVDPATAPAAAYAAQAARTAGAEAFARARQAANQAIEKYREATGALQDLWAVHVSIAAVETFLARIAPDEAEAERHRRNAADIYRRVPADLPASDLDRIQRVADTLTQGP